MQFTDGETINTTYTMYIGFPGVRFWTRLSGFGVTCPVENFSLNRTQIYRSPSNVHMYTDPDPQFLAPARSGEIGQQCPVFRRADLAILNVHIIRKSCFVNSSVHIFYYVHCN